MNLRIVRAAYRDFGMNGVWTLARYGAARVWAERTDNHRECPICGWRGREFRPALLLADGVVRPRVICPQCGAWERHRMSWLYFTRHHLPALTHSGADVIFVSPDACLEPLIRTQAASLRTSSYEHPAPGELQLDLQDLSLPDASADAFVMNSVLASIANLDRAMASLYRVLRPGGVVVSCEFLHESRTVEYQQSGYGGGHRRLGRVDLAERFAPFNLSLVDVRGALPSDTAASYGLNVGEYMLVLVKPDLNHVEIPASRP
jgi:SAM-dependent methyltransferase